MDKAFAHAVRLAGIAIIAILGAVALFLVWESYQVFITPSAEIPSLVGFSKGMSFWGFAGAALFGTVLAALIALVIAVPFSVAIALFITHYAPAKFAILAGGIIDLLAAIPSVVFGLWGMKSLEVVMRPFFAALAELFGATFLPPARNILMGGIILALMILPIITSLCREVFLQTPPLLQEAALGLGATRWEMIRMTVLPVGLTGIVSAAMLGLGRALGETMALLMVLSAGLKINFQIFSPGQHSTIASQIALNWPEASAGIERQFLIGLGLVLFALTFFVNFVARAILSRYSHFSGANA